MSIVEADPGEVVDVLEADAALDLVGRITAQNRRVNVEAGALVELVAEALKGRAWIPLGYGSWDELVTEMGWEFRPATTEDRAELVRSMRESGMSLRAIGRTVGTSKSQVERDLASTVPNGTVGPVTGVNGKTYQPTRPPAEAVDDLEMGPHADRLFPGEPDAIVEELETAGIPLTGENLDHAAEEAIESRETPLPAPNPITKPDLDGTGLSHPARYTESILPTFHDILLNVTGRVLDPFAGTGRIHQCARLNLETVGVEIEPEWANLHPDTIIGDALDLPFPDESFDAICTSPTYGNRLSDSYNAADPEKRRSYRFDLGRELHPNNSGQLKWGPDYRSFHQQAWREAERVLTPGGLFVLNITDFAIKDIPQPVAAWHVATLVALGLTYDPELSCGVHTPGLRQGTNARRIEGEFVLVFRKDPF